MAVLIPSRTPVNGQDEQFFKSLGARIASARKTQHLTQQELADQLGIPQQTLAHYEGGHVRFPASMLPTLAEILGLTLEELMGHERPKGKRGPSSRLQQQLDRISQLPKTKQVFVMEMLDAVLAKASH